MQHSAITQPDYHEDTAIISEAFIEAGRYLGFSQTQLGKIIGRDRTSIVRGIDPKSKAGELALIFIRIYRSLFALWGGNAKQMRHWLHTENLHTGGVPAEQICTIQGLLRVMDYLDAIRGKV